MMRCPTCGNECSPRAAMCPKCGEPLLGDEIRNLNKEFAIWGITESTGVGKARESSPVGRPEEMEKDPRSTPRVAPPSRLKSTIKQADPSTDHVAQFFGKVKEVMQGESKIQDPANFHQDGNHLAAQHLRIGLVYILNKGDLSVEVNFKPRDETERALMRATIDECRRQVGSKFGGNVDWFLDWSNPRVRKYLCFVDLSLPAKWNPIIKDAIVRLDECINTLLPYIKKLSPNSKYA